MEQTARLMEMVEWLAVHPWYRSGICDHLGFPGSDEEFLELFRALEEKGYYELILVLLLRYRWELDSVSTALARFLTGKLLLDWQRNGSAAMCREFRELVEQEAGRKK